MRQLSNWPIDPAYYIEDWWIFDDDSSTVLGINKFQFGKSLSDTTRGMEMAELIQVHSTYVYKIDRNWNSQKIDWEIRSLGHKLRMVDCAQCVTNGHWFWKRRFILDLCPFLKVKSRYFFSISLLEPLGKLWAR